MSGETLIVIPARFASQRYPGKPLAQLRGASGKPKTLIERSWDAAKRVTSASRIVVASDSEEILGAARAFGAEAIFTSAACRNGTERCAELIEKIDSDPDIVVNLQGDAPLIPDYFVESLIAAMRADPSIEVATPVVRCSRTLYDKLVADEKKNIVGGTFGALSSSGNAHYFSKRIIPFFDVDKADDNKLPVLLHIGLYAYRPSALRKYVAGEPSQLEQLEGLEQLRFLDLGTPIRTIEVESPPWEIWELNNPSDIPHIEASLKIMGLN